jgi:hypothetical protein
MQEINDARQESSAQNSQALFEASRMETEPCSVLVRVEEGEGRATAGWLPVRSGWEPQGLARGQPPSKLTGRCQA